MTFTLSSNRKFGAALAALLLFYLGLELVYILRFPLVMDEFGGAGLVYRMRYLIPYRDYAPYKTVLGYYIQLPVFLLPAKTWTVLLLVKVEMAVLTAAVLGYAMWLLRDRFDRRALLAALALLVVMSTFLERSAELRVDMMTGLAGLLSLVLLLRKQPIASGVLAAISFLLSQKGAFYVMATAAALLYVLAVIPGRRRETLRVVVASGSAAFVTLVLYVTSWSLVGSFPAVIRTFLSAARVATMTNYSDIRLHYWAQTLTRNPFFYALFIVAIAWLGRIGLQKRDADENLLTAYGATTAVLAALHQQPWPYFYVVVLPVALVVHASFMGHFLRSALWRRHRNACLFLFLTGGILLPLSRLSVTLQRDNGLQKRTVQVAECILQPADRYLAAVDILYRNRQSVDELQWIDRSALPALYGMSPSATAELIRRIHATPTKLLLYNYRIVSLPPPLRLYLRTEFEQLWGLIFIYAPRIAPGVFHLKFDGDYLVEARGRPILIDGRAVMSGARIRLTRGTHRYDGTHVARLKLQPPCVPPKPAPPGDFFSDVYEF